MYTVCRIIRQISLCAHIVIFVLIFKLQNGCWIEAPQVKATRVTRGVWLNIINQGCRVIVQFLFFQQNGKEKGFDRL